jgi:hypothetical protein
MIIISDELIDTLVMMFFMSKTGCQRYFGLFVSTMTNLIFACLLLILMLNSVDSYFNMKESHREKLSSDDDQEMFTDVISFLIEGGCIVIYNIVQVYSRGSVFCYKFRYYIVGICALVFL